MSSLAHPIPFSPILQQEQQGCRTSRKPCKMAEGEGFEPWVPAMAHRFSKPHSLRAPLPDGCCMFASFSQSPSVKLVSRCCRFPFGQVMVCIVHLTEFHVSGKHGERSPATAHEKPLYGVRRAPYGQGICGVRMTQRVYVNLMHPCPCARALEALQECLIAPGITVAP